MGQNESESGIFEDDVGDFPITERIKPKTDLDYVDEELNYTTFKKV